ncbi:aldo/keto reductase [Rhizobium indicum]|uniref:aldo/keto reductase n=1 Tax=Rhizobium indicum TaxID=2583231 RepID=UPI002484C9BC|nr:aldo/keto reductase [Rhizobium indicum]
MIDESIRLLGSRTITTNQVECHVYMQNRPIIDYCQKLGIAVTAYSPLARGAIVGDPVLEEIGRARGATSDQVALAFLIAKGHVVIPSSSKRGRIMQNFEARKITLTPAEIKRIEGLEKGMRLVNGDWCPVWDV